MSVAAQEAQALAQLLAARAHDTDPLAGLAPAFCAEVSTLVATPWAAAGLALSKLAARDPAVHKLTAEVQHLLKPRSVYQDPELVQRVLAVMAE
jgi:hypothetical protein